MLQKPFFEGVKVVDLTRALAGPFCTMMLADLGAEVIKVEAPPGGDESRAWGPPFINGESTYFMSINRNKKSVLLNLKSLEGRRAFMRLVEKADVLVENFRPGTTEKLGIDYGSMSKLNRGLIYCSISGFGQTGPRKDQPGYDIIAFALSGMMSITGEEGRPPVKMGVPVSDIGAGMYAAFAIAASLFRRASTGEGERIDVSLLEGQISWLTYQAACYFATGVNPVRLGSAHLTIAPYQAFKAKDDYFVVAVGNDDLWRSFCGALGLQRLRDDRLFSTNPKRVENRIKLEKELNSVFKTRAVGHWIRKLQQAGVPCSAINTLDEAFADPQVVSRKDVVEVEHPKAGRIKQLGLPYKFSDFEFEVKSPPPMLGEHTEEVLKSLGYSTAEIDRMRQRGVIG